MSTDTRPADRRIIEEASKRGADDYCMDLLLAVIQENGYTIVPSNPAPVVEALRELADIIEPLRLMEYDGVKAAVRNARAALAALPAQRERISEDTRHATPELDVAGLDLHCENYVGSLHRRRYDGCPANNRPRGGKFYVDQWCLPCEVRARIGEGLAAAYAEAEREEQGR